MRSLPQGLGLIHFVGIGGIGMSGIAEVLHNLGYKVQGSDLSEGGNTARLTALGIPVMVGHKAENIGAAEVVVVSSAIKSDNPEIVAARARRVPVVRRAEMLGELMRLKWAIAVAGTHGKTTTTSMIGALLETAQMDPTVINGGIINAYGTNTRLGEGDWMVVEADESDGTFTKLPAAIAVVTNIDPEHLDHYGDFAALQAGFESFVGNIPFYGFAVLCIDHPVVQGMIPKLSERRVRVVPTRSQQIGLAALIAVDPSRSVDENADAVGAAAGEVRSGGVAEAARDDAQGRFSEGDAVGYLGDELVAWGELRTVLGSTIAQLADGCEVLTVVAGDGAPLSEGEVEGLLPDGVDLDFHDGGQPAWWYLLAAE